MDTLTRRMREATELAPTGPDLDVADPVSEAWRRGRQRRLVRGSASAAATLAVLLVVATLALGVATVMPDRLLPADGGRERSGVTSFPQRIGHQLFVTELPSRPGPMAAVILQGSDGDGWQAVSPAGRRYRLPHGSGNWSDLHPVLSSDGRRLAYYQEEFDQVMVQDLVTGATWPLDIGRPDSSGPNGSFHTARAHQLAQQNPGWFSPSDRYVSLATFDGPVVTDLHSDATWLVPSMDHAAGWLDEDRLIGRRWPAAGDTETAELESGVDVVVWDRRTGTTTPLGRIDLTTTVVRSTTRGQWWGSVRRDGTLWMSLDEVGGEVGLLGGVRLPDLSPVELSGATTPRQFWFETPPALATVQWRGSEPVLPDDVNGGGGWRSALYMGDREDVVVFASPQLTTSVWASDAISAGSAFSAFGTSTAWWTWWWKEIALVVLGIGSLVWWRRRRPASVAE